MPHAEESLEDLRATARSLGVSDRQLRRWRSEGLLPSPVGMPGRGRGKGRGATYPEGTCEQLGALTRCVERHPKSLVDAGWCLWIQRIDGVRDHRVTAFVRGSFARAARDREAELRDLVRKSGTADDPVRIAAYPGALAGLGGIPDRFEGPKLAKLTRMGIAGLLGQFDEDEARRLFQSEFAEWAGLLMEILKVSDVVPQETLVELDAAGMWAAGFKRANMLVLREAVEEASDADFEGARDDALRYFKRWRPELARTQALSPALFLLCLASRVLDLQWAEGLDRLWADELGKPFAGPLIDILVSDEPSKWVTGR